MPKGWKKMFRQATLEERKIYYNEEWKIEDVPDFILDSLSKREFGFDHDGSGPRDRYNRFETPDALAEFLHKRAPFAVYCSVSFYERPEKREGWERAELVFDIDAKELTIKSCCEIGEVCKFCLDNAKKVTMEVVRLLKKDLKLDRIYTSYSGRGYHIRVQDEDIMPEGAEVRANVFDFVRDRLFTPPKALLNPPVKISPLTKEIMHSLIEDGTSERLVINVPGIGEKTAKKLFDNSENILTDIDNDRVRELKNTFGERIGETKKKRTRNFLEHVYMGYINLMDAKVTVDTKRILRLPPSLHSKISRKCVEVKDISSFDPEKDAVPDFMSEAK
ncbi:MAG: DNA primase catalytic subunit PriS [Candidatus Hydrothermarchaeaceae archaeon]